MSDECTGTGCNCGDAIHYAPPVGGDDIPESVLAAWAQSCRCCPECSPVICEGVMQGAPCDRICRCNEDVDDHYEEED